ncbi:MAG: hypothetical protein RLZZ608_43 [Actinomycetota bacterium]|jgi:hypothetical protein
MLSSPLRRAAAVAAISALAAGSLIAGVSVANAVPGAPTIATPADGFGTISTLIPVTGLVVDAGGFDQNVTVTAMVGGVPAASCTASVLYTDTSFGCDITVPSVGSYELVATSTEMSGDGVASAPSNAVTVVVGTDAQVTVTSHPEFDNEWPTLTPTLVGVGPALGRVSVFVYPEGTPPVGNLYCEVDPVPASGIWSCTGSNPTWNYGAASFRADGFDVTGAQTATDFGDFIQGAFVPGPPTSSYVLGPANINATIQGASGAFLQTVLYEAVLNGEGSMFTERQVCDATGNPPVITCAATGLTQGVWNFYTEQDVAEIYVESLSEYVRIPPVPGGPSATVLNDGSVRFSGTGVAGYRVLVRTVAASTVCSAIVQGSGTWRCTADLPSGTATYRAIQQSVGFDTSDFEISSDRSIDGFSAYTSAVSVTVPSSQNPVVPTPSPTAVPWTLEGYDGGALTPGQELTLFAQGLPPGTSVVIEIRSTPQVLGTALVNDLGSFELAVTIPNDLEIGEHTLVAIATPPGGVASTVAIPVAVVAAPVDVAKTSVDAPAAEKNETVSGAPGSDGAAPVDRSNPASPSAISDQIPTIDRIIRTPLLLVAAGGLALAILLLVAFPAELLNSTLASNTRRIGRWYAAIDAWVERATDWFAAVTRTRALAAAVLVVATSLIFGFIDPNYGFDPVSLRMTFSLAIGLFIVTYVSSWISGAIISRVWEIPTRISLQPAAVVFAIIGVIVARLLEFSPGFLIGLVIGLDLLTRVGSRHRVRATLTTIGVMVGLAVLAWVGFSIMTGLATGEPTAVWMLLSDAFVATTSEGLTAALAALLPLGYLHGHEIFRHSKRLWAATFVGVGTIFALIVLPTAGTGPGDSAQLGFWILVMAGFAVVTLSLWAVLHFTGQSESDEESTEQSLETVR